MRRRMPEAYVAATPQEKTFSGLAIEAVIHQSAHVFNPGTRQPQTRRFCALHNTPRAGGIIQERLYFKRLPYY